MSESVSETAIVSINRRVPQMIVFSVGFKLVGRRRVYYSLSMLLEKIAVANKY